MNSELLLIAPTSCRHNAKPIVEPTPTVKILRIIAKINELPLSLNKSIMKKK
jgi:hypothetical protein